MNYTKYQYAIRQMHGCEAEHASTVPIREQFNGATVWDGEVEVFRLRGHPQADTCYVWAYHGDDGKEHYTAVLGLPPVNSPRAAVQAALVAQVKNERKKA